jgi:magnesium chelatase family protein
MARLAKRELLDPAPGESSEAVRSRVEAARAIQASRYGSKLVTNASAPTGQFEASSALSPEGRSTLDAALDFLALSGRGADRVVRVARSLADLDGVDQVAPEHVPRHWPIARTTRQERPWHESGCARGRRADRCGPRSRSCRRLSRGQRAAQGSCATPGRCCRNTRRECTRLATTSPCATASSRGSPWASGGRGLATKWCPRYRPSRPRRQSVRGRIPEKGRCSPGRLGLPRHSWRVRFSGLLYATASW